jgi:ligand-binding sensor domain-containing protein
MKIVSPHIIFFITLLCTLQATAQQPAYTYYSIRDGLASNDTYNCVEDKKGFLWIATENGVSRFDGKNFKNYTTAQGLPDNDILVIEMDNAGVIWVLPFQRTPAYYDEKTDRFINSKTDKELAKITLSAVNNSNPLSNGGVSFCNSSGSFFVYKNGKCTEYKVNGSYGSNITRVISLDKEKYVSVCYDSLRLFENGKVVNSVFIQKNVKRSAYVNGQLFIADSATLFKMAILPNGNISNVKKNILPFKIVGLNFTGKQLAISSGSGNIYFADTASLEFSQQGFSFNALIRYIYEDKVGNTWICSRETGLIRYQQKGILTINETAYNRNFNSICFWNNKLVAGTNEGQVYIYKGAYDYKILTIGDQKNYSSWIRQLGADKNNLIIAAEGGLFSIDKNLTQKPIYTKAVNVANKGFIFLNDSTLIAGNSAAVRKINFKNFQVTDSFKVRVTKLAVANENSIYVGANIGLYKWEYFKNLNYLGDKNELLKNRVSALAYGKEDNLLFVGLALDTLAILQNDKIIATIPLGTKLPGNECRALFTEKKGVLWVGTNVALGRVTYTINNNKVDYKIAVFTTADGLAGKQINDIKANNDTIYVATNAGISIVPASISFEVPNIPVYITGISINNVDTVLQNSFSLAYWQNNINIRFNASDLGTTTDHVYEYKINNEPWHVVNNDNISLPQLSPGNYKIQVRTLNRDGNPSNIIAEVRVVIKNAFWKTSWFWALCTLILLAFLFYITQRRNKIKRETTVQKLLTEKKLSDLELRALKAQINPHFVFNCLNSIKYLNYQKRFVETDIYLDKFSYLLRKTLDFSGLQKITWDEELAYSKNYLELEKLRLGEKLNYDILIEATIDISKTIVPPMLLQPYLENAIKHGIRHLPGEEGRVTIDLKRQQDKIICSIKDNGIGIDNATVINKKNNPTHISHGTTLQQRRADLYDVTIDIITGKNGVGTTVILTLQNEQSL